VNCKQRRKLRRIWQRAQSKQLNQNEKAFVVSHAPKRVCVMSNDESHRFQDVSIGHRCTSTSHSHYTRKHVDVLVQRGEVVWVGDHYKIAAWIREQHWENRDQAMQLLPGNASKRGAMQHCQNIPAVSGYRGGNVAMQNDGRVE
jgi:tRNA G37 N-methylase TrmD